MIPGHGSDEIEAKDIPLVSDYLGRLEGLGHIEAGILKTTKIHKVMKYIAQKMKPQNIPHEAEFQLISRSHALWRTYLQILAEDAHENTDDTGIAARLGTSLNINDDHDTSIELSRP